MEHSGCTSTWNIQEIEGKVLTLFLKNSFLGKNFENLSDQNIYFKYSKYIFQPNIDTIFAESTQSISSK